MSTTTTGDNAPAQIMTVAMTENNTSVQIMPVGIAVRALSSILQDPMDSRGCAALFISAAVGIRQACGLDSTKTTEVAKSHPTLSRAAIAFFTLPRSPSEHVEMLSYLTRCECVPCHYWKSRSPAIDTPALSEDIFVASPYVLTRAFRILIKLLIAVLKALPARFRHRKPGRVSSEQPWPLGPDDLLPHGVERSVIAFEQWASGQYGFEVDILSLCSRLAIIYEPFGKKIFGSPPTLGLILPLQQLKNSMKPHLDNGRVLSVEDRAEDFEYECRNLLLILNELIYGDPKISHPAILALVKQKISTCAILDDLLKCLSSLPPEHESLKRKLGLSVNSVHSMFNMVETFVRAGGRANPNANPKIDIGPVMSHVSSADDATAVLATLADARKRGCANIRCPEGGDRINVKGQLCSQCNSFRFCGEKCLREAWRDPEVSHKSICSKIAVLKKKLGPRGWASLWRLDVNGAYLRNLCAETSVDMALIKDIRDDITTMDSMLFTGAQWLLEKTLKEAAER